MKLLVERIFYVMIRDKKIIFIGFQFFLSIVFVKISGLTDIFHLYYGIQIGSVPMLYIVYIGQFISLSMYVFGVVEEYISGYGIYVLTRLNCRKRLQEKIKWILLKRLLIYEVTKAGICLGLNLFVLHVSLQWGRIVSGIVLTFAVNYIFVILQMLLEIKISARSSVLITSSLYIAMLLLPDLLMIEDKSIKCFLLLLPNLSMDKRVLLAERTYFIIVLWLIFLATCLWYLFVNTLKKKDII